MLLAQECSFALIVESLKESADLVKNQRKEEAKNRITAIAGQIEYLSDVSKQRETEFEQKQATLSNEIGELIKKEAEVRNAALDTQKKIAKVNEQIGAQSANQQELINSLMATTTSLMVNKRKLAEHQARWDRLNDDSAGSIVLSIFSLGLDRAIMGIDSLVHQDKQSIAALEPEVERYRRAVEESKDDLQHTQEMLANLRKANESSQAAVRELDRRQAQLHDALATCRKKAAFFTNVALFYGKLVELTNQVDRKIDNVVDIIEELDDDSPTIVDFDGSGDDVISLREALNKFDLFLGDHSNYLGAEVAPPALEVSGASRVVGIFSEDGNFRLDIGTRAMKQNVPASHESWATRLILKRLDGPNTGPISPDHVVGIFSMNERFRLDIGTRAMKENVPADHESWATRLRIVPLNRVGGGPVQYNEVVGIFSEDGKFRLDIGTGAVKEDVPASHNSWATRLRIREA